jgi:hypothetical protein
VDRSDKKSERQSAGTEAERRRVGTVVHDDRGNASVHWRDAPDDYERTKLEVLSEAGPTPRSERGCDPYFQRGTGSTLRAGGSGAGNEPRRRTDLRRLSEHIKLMRELEARKRDQHD